MLLISLFGCATNPVTGRSELMLVSEGQEISMGKEAGPALNWDFGGEFRDPQLEAYLSGIVGRIWSISERPNLPFSFHIQNTSLPNAFALPGYVAMTRGLLVELDNEAQFAAVMGHEAGHVMARHSAARISRGILAQAGLGVGGALLGSGRGSDALMTLGSIGTSLLLLKYDRSQELEADRLGVKYAARLGYDPHEALRAHDRLQAAAAKYLKQAGKDSGSGGLLDSLLSTHPRHEVRVEEIRRMIDELPPYSLKGDGKLSPEFSERLKVIRKVNEAYLVSDDALRALEKKNYDEAERLVRKAIGMEPGQASFYAVLGRISLAKDRYDNAIKDFNAALGIDSGYQPAWYGLGVSEYKKGSLRSALEHLRKSLSLYPNHPGSLYASGLCYHDINSPREALSYFGTFAGLVETHPEVYGYMGMDYEKIGRTDLAVEAYLAQVAVEPNNRMGIYARQRLAVMRPLLQRR